MTLKTQNGCRLKVERSKLFAALELNSPPATFNFQPGAPA